MSGGHICIEEIASGLRRRLSTLGWDREFEENLIRWRRINFEVRAWSRRVLEIQLEWIYRTQLESEIPAKRLLDFRAVCLVGKHLDYGALVQRVLDERPDDPLRALLECAANYEAYFEAGFYPSENSMEFFLYPLNKPEEEPDDFIMAKYHRFLCGKDPRDLDPFDYLPSDLSQIKTTFKRNAEGADEESEGPAQNDTEEP